MMKSIIFFAAAVAAATVVSALNNGQAPTPTLGWSTWGSFGGVWTDYCNDTAIRAQVLAMKANGMYDLGYDTVLIDDCWEATHRTPEGKLTWDVSRFPNGMASLAEFCHAHKFKLYIYASVGTYTCSSGGRPGQVPGSYGRYQEDVDTMASWNVDGIKYDYCKVPNRWDGAQLYINASRAVMNTSRPLWLQCVAGVEVLLHEVSEYCNDFRATPDHHDDWRNTMENLAIRMLNAEIKLEPAGKPNAWSDMDVLATGGTGPMPCAVFGNQTVAHCPGMTNTQYMSEFTLWNVLQSPLIPMTSLVELTPIMKRILYNKLFIDINQDTRTPPGNYIGGDQINCPVIVGELVCTFWLRKLADGSVFLVMFNAQNQSATLDFVFDTWTKHLPAGWGSQTTVSIQDMWNPTFSAAHLPPRMMSAKERRESIEMNMMPASGFGTVATGHFRAMVDASGVASVLLKQQ